MFFVAVCVSSVWGFKGPFLAWMTGGLRGSSAVGIAVVNSVANAGKISLIPIFHVLFFLSSPLTLECPSIINNVSMTPCSF
jgi:hypothetical protein